MQAGIKVFASLEEAKAAGFFPYEKVPDGLLVRRDDGRAFSLAIVRVTPPADEGPPPPDAA